MARCMIWHASLGHFIGNLVLFMVFTPPVWRALGTLRLIALLAAAQVAGTLAQQLSDMLIADPRPLLGASAIGYGLIAAYGWIHPKSCPLPMQITGRQIALIAAICTATLTVFAPRSSVAHAAHVGGMVGTILMLKTMEVIRKTT